MSIRKASFVESCAAIIPELRDRGIAAETQRKIPEESIAQLTSAGVFSVFTPRRFGGPEYGLDSIFDGFIELAQGCPSTGWVATLLALHGFIVSRFSEAAQSEVWEHGPDQLIAASVAPSGKARRLDNGFRLEGKWSFLSGIDHCRWALLNVLVVETDSPGPAPYLLLVPAADYDIEDDWHVSGLRGTGSKSIRLLGDVFVPEHRALRLNIADHVVGQTDSWLSRIPWQPLFTYGFAAPAIGTALGTYNAFRQQISTRRSVYTQLPFRDRPATLQRIARAFALVDEARLILRRDLLELESCGRMGAPLPELSFERMLFDAASIVDSTSRAVLSLFKGGGGHALYDSNVLQRSFRDMYAMTQHAAVDFDLASERFGRSLLR